MSEERRANPNPYDIAGVLAILYTMGYLTMVGFLYFVEIPPPNKEPLLQLFGLMSAIQMALIGFYFGGSKQVEATQRATEQSKARAETVVQEIASKAVPAAAPPLNDLKADNVNVETQTAVVTERKEP